MVTAPNQWRRRIFGALLSAVIVPAMLFGLSATPAHAASIISATVGISAGPVPGYQANVWVPMNRQDANGYLWWGARVEIELWADDAGGDYADNRLHSDSFVASSPELFVADEGIFVNVFNAVPCSVMNEDNSAWNGNVVDEFYLKARFVDADGGVVQTRTSVVSEWISCG